MESKPNDQGANIESSVSEREIKKERFIRSYSLRSGSSLSNAKNEINSLEGNPEEVLNDFNKVALAEVLNTAINTLEKSLTTSDKSMSLAEFHHGPVYYKEIIQESYPEVADALETLHSRPSEEFSEKELKAFLYLFNKVKLEEFLEKGIEASHLYYTFAESRIGIEKKKIWKLAVYRLISLSGIGLIPSRVLMARPGDNLSPDETKLKELNSEIKGLMDDESSDFETFVTTVKDYLELGTKVSPKASNSNDYKLVISMFEDLEFIRK